MVGFARALPRLREHVDDATSRATTSPREHVLAVAVRLLDRGFFRIGSEDYAVRNETYGLATMKKRHVRLRRRHAALRLPRQARQAPRPGRRGPRGRRRRSTASSAAAAAATSCWPTSAAAAGPTSSRPTSTLPQGGDGPDVSAKDFRTWGATVLAAVAPGGPRRGAPTLEDGREAGRQPRRQGGRVLPRQHAGGRARLVHRPARLRPLPRRQTIAPGVVAADDGTAIQGAVEEAVLGAARGLGVRRSGRREGRSTASSSADGRRADREDLVQPGDLERLGDVRVGVDDRQRAVAGAQALDGADEDAEGGRVQERRLVRSTTMRVWPASMASASAA